MEQATAVTPHHTLHDQLAKLALYGVHGFLSHLGSREDLSLTLKLSSDFADGGTSGDNTHHLHPHLACLAGSQVFDITVDGFV